MLVGASNASKKKSLFQTLLIMDFFLYPCKIFFFNLYKVVNKHIFLDALDAKYLLNCHSYFLLIYKFYAVLMVYLFLFSFVLYVYEGHVR